MSNEVIAGVIGAIVGAVLSGVFTWLITWLTTRGAQISAMKDDLRKTLSSLIELREDMATRVSAMADVQQRESAGSFLNVKRSIYLEDAENIVRRIPKHVLASEYNVLGMEHQFVANFSQAESYFKSAVRASRSLFDKIVALRSLAGFYFFPSPRRDFDAGRKYFQAAADLLKNPTDSYSNYLLGYTYEMWGIVELQCGFEMEGQQKIARARKYYSDMDQRDPLKGHAVASLQAKLAQLEGGFTPAGLTPVIPSPLPPQPDQLKLSQGGSSAPATIPPGATTPGA